MKLPLKRKIIVLSSFPLFFLFLIFYTFQFGTIGKIFVTEENELLQGLNATIESSFDENQKIDSQKLLPMESILDKNKVEYIHIDIIDMTGYKTYEIIYENKRLTIVPNPTSGPSIPKIDKDLPISIHRSIINLHGKTGILEAYYTRNPSVIGLRIGLRTLLVYGTLLSLIASSLIGFILSRIVVRPLQKMEHSIQLIQKRGFKGRMPSLHSQDEIGRLTSIFNEMMDQLEKAYNKQKQFIEDASHELRTPITALEGHLSLLNRWGKKDEQVLEESLQASSEEIKRLRRLVQELLELSRDVPNMNEEIIDPVSQINTVVKRLVPIHPEFILEVICNYERQDNLLFIKCVPSHFDQIIVILLDNAIKYSTDNKEITISIQPDSGNKNLFICITDRGIGIAKENIPYIFDRFYRADQSRSRQSGGYGLGLSIAKRLVENYNGKIEVSSVEKEGTTFTICFPLLP